MQNTGRTYIAIDLKSFYASVECVERGLDPLTTNLVVADRSRTEKTICLAVSPSLKAYGIPGRARLFEVEQRLRAVNAERKRKTNGYRLTGKSVSDMELKAHPDWEVDYIAAPPRMAYYIEHSTRIYQIYLNYIAPEDIHVYSIDEVFMDVTAYLPTYGVSAHELARRIIGDVLRQTGITATAGIGTNLYLCKVAMDIEAKHIPADKDGVRIAELDEMAYRRKLWTHRPLRDFWRVGKGIADKLEQYGIYTMGDIARQSVKNEELLYQLFGINAELLIDHAWGWEPCTMEMIKAYRPSTNSFSSGQVLQEQYTVRKARVVVREMAESAALDLLDKRMVTDQLVLTVGYDTASLTNGDARTTYKGEVTTDHYGRKVPKHAHGTANLESATSSARIISEAVMELFDRIVNPDLLVRRINLTTNHVVDEETAAKNPVPVQYDLFTDYEALEREQREEKEKLAKERKVQTAILNIKKQFGKNAILKGLNYEEGATAKERNEQIGGHKALKHPYDDIIDLPHHVSERHPQMSMYNRAAQFVPFAALTGHDAAITEAARLTDAELELSESDAEVLNRKLAYLQSLDEKPTISVTYFVPDDRKKGGSYHTTSGIIKRIESDEGVLQFEDGTGIPVIRIKDIDGECFLTE